MIESKVLHTEILYFLPSDLNVVPRSTSSLSTRNVQSVVAFQRFRSYMCVR